MFTQKQYIEEGEKVLLHTYNRYKIVLDRGEGAYLFDLDGKKYLDFASGIGVFALGYQNEEFNNALKDQIDKLIHTSNYYYNIPAVEAAKKLAKVSTMDRVFFTNSGAEAIEGAIKAARKYAYSKDGMTDHEIIAMENSFHGRSMGALSVTGNPKYQEAFRPMIGNVKFAKINNIHSIKELINSKTCAILLETVQGEGGIIPAEKEFLMGIKEICDKQDILFILDEIQCGMGRCGHMFAWQEYGVKPDIMTCAKALGGGIPVGAFLMTEKTAKSSLTTGDHGTTYGGNPLASAGVNKVLELFEKNDMISHVRKVTGYLEQRLNQLVEEHDFILMKRGKGLMQGLVLNKEAGPVIEKAMEEGLIVISAGTNVLRLLPPLIINEEQIDEMFEKLKRAFAQ